MSFDMTSRLVCVLTLTFLISCATDKRPKYVAPASPKSDVATLKGGWGTYIHEVDGARVDTNIQLANWGSNSVDVNPGPHELIVLVHTSSSMSYDERGGKFTFRC